MHIQINKRAAKNIRTQRINSCGNSIYPSHDLQHSTQPTLPCSKSEPKDPHNDSTLERATVPEPLCPLCPSKQELKETWLHLFKVKVQWAKTLFLCLFTHRLHTLRDLRRKGHDVQEELIIPAKGPLPSPYQISIINSWSSCHKEHGAFTWVHQTTETTKKEEQEETSAQPLCDVCHSP